MADRDSGHLFGPGPKRKTGRRRPAAPGGLLAPPTAAEVHQAAAGRTGPVPPDCYVDLAVDVYSDPETTFTYRWRGDLGAVPPPGTPLLIQYGPGQGALRIGWLIRERPAGAPPPVFSPTGRKLRYRPVLERIGAPGLLPADLLDLAQFMSRYYRAPLGECLSAMVPPPVIRQTERKEIRRLAPAHGDYAALPAQAAALIGKKPAQAAVLQALAIAHEPLTRPDLLALCKQRGAGGGAGAIAGLLKAGALLELAEHAPDPYHLPGLGGNTTPWPLTPDQAAAFAAIAPALAAAQFAPFLLHGITGSGKTEVYLHALAACLKQRRSALILVPEITLTPQTLARIKQRAGDCVVTLHSHLTEGVRADHWQRARDGRAQVVVGTRSAVFAPLTDIGLIVVDEEHETTYKQDNSPRYNGRDLALWRGQKHNAVVILGSATPSLTSYHAAQTGKFRLLELPRRVGAAELPRVELIDTNAIERRWLPATASESTARGGGKAAAPPPAVDTESEFTGAYGDDNDPAGAAPTAAVAAPIGPSDHYFEASLAPPLTAALTRALAANHQAILFVNRRGQHPVRHCRHCGWIDRCEHCDQVMTFHRVGPPPPEYPPESPIGPDGRPVAAAEHASVAPTPPPNGFRVCHLCGSRESGVALRCPVCHSFDLHFLGAGTQKVEQELAQTFPAARIARLDSDITQNRSALLTVLTGLMNGDIQILIGTQIVAKGLDFPNVTLVGIVDADSSLRQCDYHGAERTFQLISQVTGRAGRGQWPGEVYIQTALPNATPIQHALRHDYAAFAKEEIEHRRALGYPPHRRMARVVLQSRDYPLLKNVAADFARAWRARLPAHTAVKGPTACQIHKIKDLFRWHLVGFAPDHAALTRLLTAMPPIDKKIQRIVDVDPQNLL